MINLAKALLIGRLTEDPEIRYTAKGLAVGKMRLAVNFRGKDKKEESSFFDVVAFGQLAEQCGEYLSKGRAVLVEGRMHQKRWETKEGRRGSKLEILAATVEFLDPPPEGGKGPDKKQAREGGEEGVEPSPSDDEPPF
jgi:single-strand DNA-binding protein